MPRKLKRDPLWNEILESGIFEDPSLFHDGTFWCVSFRDPNKLIKRSFITIGRNLGSARQWIEKNTGDTYP